MNSFNETENDSETQDEMHKKSLEPIHEDFRPLNHKRIKELQVRSIHGVVSEIYRPLDSRQITENHLSMLLLIKSTFSLVNKGQKTFWLISF